MKQRRGKRIAQQLSKSLRHRLNAYALAATAAQVGMLALAQPAEARIIYTPVHHVIGRNGRYKIDLSHDKVGDLTLANTYGCNQDYCQDGLSAFPSAGNGVEGKYSLAYALDPGARIGPKQPFSGKIMALSSSGEGTFGQWVNVSNGYLGVKFNIKGKTHYGWLRLSVQLLGQARVKATLTGYAYESVPNRVIVAGKTKGPEVSMVQPASLGLLAAGVLAIPAWRNEPVGVTH
jgi:hypothetical protein